MTREIISRTVVNGHVVESIGSAHTYSRAMIERKIAALQAELLDWNARLALLDRP